MTRAKHKRAFFRQIQLPVILFLAVTLPLIVYLVLQGRPTVAVWSDIATIMLVIVWMLVALILLAIFSALLYLVSYVLKILPPYARLAQEGIETVKMQVEKGADISAKPVIQIKSFLAVVNAIFRRNQ